jgi:sec-independent protein translocase protein TatC
MPDDREWPDSGARDGEEPLPDDTAEGDGFAFVGEVPDAGDATVDVDGVDWADPDSLADHGREDESPSTDDESPSTDDADGGEPDLADAVADAGIDWGAHDDLLSDPTLVADVEDEADDAGDGSEGDDRSPTDAAREGESVVDRAEPAAPGEAEGTEDADEPPTPVEPDGPPEHMEPTPPVTDEDGREAADGGTTQVAGATPPGVPEDDDGLLGQGPDEDVEMPLADHIEEMINRLAVVMLVGGVVALAVFPVADQLINYLWNAHIPGAAEIADRRPRLYGPLELPLTEIKIAVLAGLLVGLPVLVYQSYRFMRPGLYPRERRYYLAAVPTSLVLATVGVAFSHFVVLPAIFAYFTSYTTGTALVAFGLKETFNLILLLMGYMAVVFQIPLLIQLGIMMGLVSREWLEARRLLFWGGFAGLAFLVSPDPTGMAPIIVATTMIVLFEGTLTLLRWTGN